MPTKLTLTATDQAMLAGEHGAAAQLAMRVIVQMARVLGAQRLRDVSSAHIDGCLYHGQAGLDFAERLVALGGRVAVPTTLNVSSLDLLHPHLYRGDAETGQAARRLMAAYLALGCQPSWTCAPYQLAQRPSFGEHVAWAESNAIVFANSVLGARTERYGDFSDICAALTGRVPDTGLHLDANRRGQIVVELHAIPDRLLFEDVLYPVLGHLIGHATGSAIPVIDGLPATTSEDQLKALGAAAASSGSVALFHAVGVTPEAPTLDAALHGHPPERIITITPDQLTRARDELTTASNGKLSAVSIGTPHFSLSEFAQLMPLLAGKRVHADVYFYASTGRDVLAELDARGWTAELERFGVQLVVDTCTYITPILRGTTGTAMTNSAKWAYYAPGNLGLEVAFGSLRECIESAVRGEVWRDGSLWDAGRGTGDEGGTAQDLSYPASPSPRFSLSHPPIAQSFGAADGTALVLTEPLSFWGGFDSASGRITDRRHPQHGAQLTGRVLVMPGGRGSSSSSSVLAEAIRRGTAPAAILLREPDQIIAIGALVAGELYGRWCPVVVLDEGTYARIQDGENIQVRAAGDEVIVEITS